jgi:succinate dehydrogenase hydrophobic anchor subunit
MAVLKKREIAKNTSGNTWILYLLLGIILVIIVVWIVVMITTSSSTNSDHVTLPVSTELNVLSILNNSAYSDPVSVV